MIRGSTQLYAIVGHPVSQVKSPEIFNRWFAQQGMDAVMIPLDVRPEGLAAFVELMRFADNLRGVVVTIPYKEAITRYIDRPSAQVSALGVANVLRVGQAGEIVGDMTDGRGFVRALGDKGVAVHGKHVFILGCGGAGSAVAWDVLGAGAARVSLSDLDGSRAGGLRARLATRYRQQEVRVVREAPAEFDIVLNATSLGMNPNDPLPVPLERIPPGAVVADAVTAPPETPFLKGAAMRGHRVQSGAEMAAGQAPLIAEFFGLPGLK
ncbi:MAG: shikimate dehydrogenase [Deferrisomatales bacterium]|nr:shikimate dehydrogenase [Deferrisomatales bacterium]